MDTSPQEKKWFVFIRDHHEGPFTLADLKDKLLQGVINSQFYVWTEGMKDWEMMNKVELLKDLVGEEEVRNQKSISSVIKITSEESQPASDVASVTEIAAAETEVESPQVIVENIDPAPVTVPTPEPEPAPIPEPEPAPTPIAESVVAEISTASEAAPVSQEVDPTDSDPASFVRHEAPDPTFDARRDAHFLKKIFRPKVIGVIAVLAVLGGLYAGGFLGILFRGFSPVVSNGQEGLSNRFRPMLIQLVERFPVLSNWVSPIPPMPDISQIDFEEMKQVAVSAVEKDGPKGTFALSIADPRNPTFKIASNLMDGAVFEIITLGVPETLVGATRFVQQLEVPVFQRHGKSAVLRSPGGAPIPRGEYWVYLVESQKQPIQVQQQIASFPPASKSLPSQVPVGRKVAVSKKVFMGGDKDRSYDVELKKYHEDLFASSQRELTDLEKHLTTQNEMLLGTIESYAKLKSGPKKKSAIAMRNSKNAWIGFDRQFQQQQSMLDPSFASWTEDGLKSVYHADLFQSLVRVRFLVQDVHKLQVQFVDQAQMSPSELTMLTQAATQAQDEIKNLLKKINEIKATPFDPNGLPPRGNS